MCEIVEKSFVFQGFVGEIIEKSCVFEGFVIEIVEKSYVFEGFVCEIVEKSCVFRGFVCGYHVLQKFLQIFCAEPQLYTGFQGFPSQHLTFTEVFALFLH